MDMVSEKASNQGEHLVLVVGPSGSGKDTIIYEAFRKLRRSGITVRITQRWITRPSHGSENFRSVSVEEFKDAVAKGEFVLWWHIYGLYYGVPAVINSWLDAGDLVLVNVSRGVLNDARKLYPSCKIVKIDVPAHVSEKRVRSRDREHGSQLEARIKRMRSAVPMPDPDLVILNIKKRQSVMSLVQYLEGLVRN
ncbi:MAG: phosphonate metabolism protein/1,5-bisphosphokinase (PRPP-forming) PhnN [Candidatus Hodarchaeales archaeon]